MDNLIVMTARAAGGHGRAPVGGSAEILFFTGVRYFRQVEESAFLPQASGQAPAQPTTVTPTKARAPRRRRVDRVAKAAEAARLEQQA